MQRKVEYKERCGTCVRGRITCRRCSGKGKYYEWREYGDIKCPDCNGVGSFQCPTCGGEEWVKKERWEYDFSSESTSSSSSSSSYRSTRSHSESSGGGIWLWIIACVIATFLFGLPGLFIVGIIAIICNFKAVMKCILSLVCALIGYYIAEALGINGIWGMLIFGIGIPAIFKKK
ncbi:MAG: hypothetical protein J6A73_05245 [Lachnospiraceae bacterium]|nr:hypothetical protein [Lachnospiraceae bacterium]